MADFFISYNVADFKKAEWAATPPGPAAAESLRRKAEEELNAAAELVADRGYHKRDAERDELDEVLTGKSLLRDLPIRV
jgi:hypothetical protein